MNLIVNWTIYIKYLYGIVVLLTFMCEGAMGAILSTLSLQVFGSNRGTEIFSYLYASFGT
jgi:hypothetical protein